MKPSTGRPPAKAKTAGIDWMPNWPASAGFSSMLTLTSLIAPAFSLTTFSSAGVSWRQGPHHGAQKSTSTGWSSEALMTSAAKAWVVESLTSAPAAGAAPLVAGAIRHVHDRLLSLLLAARQRRGKVAAAAGSFGLQWCVRLGI